MSEHRYSKAGVGADYLRAGGGAIVAAAALFSVDSGPVVRIILVLVVMLFIGYGVTTWHRQRTTVHASEDGILAEGWLKIYVAWSELESVGLNYYSTKRDRKGGWMQLGLKGAGTHLKIHSTLDGFDEIVARATQEAMKRGLSLTPTTVENLRLLGIEAETGEIQEGAR